MTVDLSTLGKIAQGVVLLIAGGFIGRFFERRPRIIAFYSHVGEFRVQQSGVATSSVVRTHSVVIRNNGRAAAENLHVPHNGMLSAANIHVSIDPSSISHSVKPLPNNAEESFFPTLPAKFQVTISYLYFPPLLVNQINAQIYSDEGPARQITVLPQQQFPKWALALAWLFLLIGFFTVIYFSLEEFQRVFG